MLKQASHEPQQQTLTSIEHGSFDTGALQDELARALEEDRKYKLTDSMKKRAIHTAASYDEFKNLVACADLKPVSQRELQSFNKSDRVHNLSYKKPTNNRKKTFGSELQFTPQDKVDTPPANAVDFARQWRRNLKTNAQKYNYLRLATAARLAAIFKADIDTDLMADIVHVVLRAWQERDLDNSSSAPPPERNEQQESGNDDDHAVFAYATLEAFTKTTRFGLILDFLDNNQIERLRDLFELLEKHHHHDAKDELLVLKKAYKL